MILAALLLLAQAAPRPPVTSHITVISFDGTGERVIYSSPELFEAPNWSPDGKYLLLNSRGKLWRLALDGGAPVEIDARPVERANNDHGISPDGTLYALSAGHIYLVDAPGGPARQITHATPSYYHGWSPDGRWLVYCASRPDNGKPNFDLYRIGIEGGREVRLTAHAGYDDGPDYSPDGNWIYFNSDRSGSWDIWRIPPEGAGENDARAVRVTFDEYEDWFPHPSPDGRWLVFVSFAKGTKGHPANQNVVLRRMDRKTAQIVELKKLFGGQGTINVNSWSPDSKRFAFVRYQLRD
ncbi:MAG: hypothetical protein SFV18_06130 [Bryobacteraceae bacterium]|nr:hypothetical protein [Bryobacteraceae bacterium]